MTIGSDHCQVARDGGNSMQKKLKNCTILQANKGCLQMINPRCSEGQGYPEQGLRDKPSPGAKRRHGQGSQGQGWQLTVVKAEGTIGLEAKAKSG